MGDTEVGSAPPLSLIADRYRLDGWLSGGSDRFTALGFDTHSGSSVIIKFEHAGGRTSLVREYEQLRRLSHPNIAQVIDVGQLSQASPLHLEVAHERRPLAGFVYLVTARVVGTTLTPLKGTTAERAAKLELMALELAGALAYVHQRNLIHGDVTPSNVAIDGNGASVLLDFGLAGPSKASHGGQGTPGFAAPEALVGQVTERSDLFGLGATLYFAWAGVAPYGSGRQGVVRMLAGDIPQPLVEIPAWLEALLLSLLQLRPENRPPSALHVLQTLRRSSGTSDDAKLLSSLTLESALGLGDPLSGVFVGRDVEREQVGSLLEALAAGRATEHTLVLSGLPGSGRRTLWSQALSEFRLRSIAANLADVSVVTAASLLASAPAVAVADPARAATSRQATLFERVSAQAARGPLCVLVEQEPGGQDWDWSSWRQLSADAPGSCLLVVFANAGTAVPSSPGFLHFQLAPFSRAEIAQLCKGGGLGADEGTVDRVATDSSGNAAMAVLLVRRLRAGDALHGSSPSSPVDSLRQDFLTLPARTMNAVLASWWDLPLSAEVDPQNATRRGWLRSTGRGVFEVPEGVQREALWGTVPVTLNVEVIALAQAAVRALPFASARRAEALRICGDQDSAFDAFVAAARGRHNVADFARAEALWKRALPLADLNAWSQDDIVSRAQGLALLGRYELALQWLNAQPKKASLTRQVRLSETHAWLARRRGDLNEADQILQTAQRDLAAAPPATDGPHTFAWARERLEAQRARVALSAGRHLDAIKITDQIMAADLDTKRVVLETRALASSYLGRSADATGSLDELKALASVTNERDDVAPLWPKGDEAEGRLCTIAGIAAQFQQDMVAAEQSYGLAIAAYERIGDVHGYANARLNQAMALAEQGRYIEALRAFARAFDDLLRLGAYGDATAAAFNAGLLFARMGDSGSVAAAMGRVTRAAEHKSTNAASAWLECLAATAAWHQGEFIVAAQRHAKAAHLFESNADPLHKALSWLSCAEAWADAGRISEANDAREQAGDLAQQLPQQSRWLEARLLLAVGSALSTGSPVSDLAIALSDAARHDANKRLRPSAFRSALLAARLFARVQNTNAFETCVALAARMHEEVKMQTPTENQAALDSDPDATWLARWRNTQGAVQPVGNAAFLEMAQKLALAQSRLRRFVRLSKRINSELRLPRLLETILDTVIELTEAERGFLLLRDAQGTFVVRAARNIDQTSLEGETLAFSRSIAEQVASTGAPVITVDATGDARFAQALSVSDLQLRSVVAVPLTIKGQVDGAIYVDNRLRQGAFGDNDVATLLDFSELAALAVGNAKLVSDLQRRDRQIDILNRRLEKELAARKDEISSMRVELSDSRESFALRFDYKNIIGRSPRMMELLRLLDRASETNLPVIIQGESGTGKELVARALVANGPRKSKPFITENCAALAETLLESTLFGYTRGAFTGADRDTRGLFAIAHEGTLFLDEVGEMSAGLQGKLLRVLQDGEYRRVGGQRTERTDIRIIVATNKDLQSMVNDGIFRQDLFFRLAVVRVHLPPLRERSEDIPLLVRHFLDAWKDRPGVRARTVSPEALSRLCSYRWPGNIRELENELGRATAFAETTIQVADLSPHIAGQGSAEAIRSGDDLALKNQVERLEKTLIREALTKFSGNQTRAAEALGLSRFGLQKKLRRYGFP